jgi:CDGSH-type Zn-finger protein
MAKPASGTNRPFVMEMEPGTYYWCACGRTKNQPFCDGSHKGTDIAPMKVDIKEKKTVAWCGCRKTANRPYCDGSHAKK